MLRIQHCASSKAELLFAFMPLASAGSSFRVAFHRVDEIAADVKWSRGMGCARIDRPGYYVILSLSPTLQDADLVRIEYSLTQQSFVSDPLSMLAANASCDAVGLRAFGEEAGLAPRFATVKIGSELHATIRLVAASAEAVGCGAMQTSFRFNVARHSARCGGRPALKTATSILRLTVWAEIGSRCRILQPSFPKDVLYG